MSSMNRRLAAFFSSRGGTATTEAAAATTTTATASAADAAAAAAADPHRAAVATATATATAAGAGAGAAGSVVVVVGRTAAVNGGQQAAQHHHHHRHEPPPHENDDDDDDHADVVPAAAAAAVVVATAVVAQPWIQHESAYNDDDDDDDDGFGDDNLPALRMMMVQDDDDDDVDEEEEEEEDEEEEEGASGEDAHLEHETVRPDSHATGGAAPTAASAAAAATTEAATPPPPSPPAVVASQSLLKVAPASNCMYNPASPHDRRKALQAVVARNGAGGPRQVWPTLPEEWQRDKTFVLAALRQHSDPLPSKTDFERKFPQALRFDRDVVLAFCHRPDFARLFRDRHLYVPGCLSGDKEVMMAYCRRIARSLQECSEQLCDDYDVVEAAVSLGGVELQYASTRLREDKTLVRMACETYGRALEFCPTDSPTRKELVGDRTFMHDVVLAGPGGGPMLKLAPPHLQNDPDLLLQALTHGLPLRHVPPRFLTVSFLKDAIRGNARLYLDLPPHGRRWQQSPTLALEAVLAHDSTPVIQETALGEDGCPHLRHDRRAVLAICHRGSVDLIRDLLDGGDGGTAADAAAVADAAAFDAIAGWGLVADDDADAAIIIGRPGNAPSSRFCDDLEVMKVAVGRDPTLFSKASPRLQELPELIVSSISPDTALATLKTISATIQREHPEIPIQAIRVCAYSTLRYLPTHMPEDLWQNHRDVCIAWIRRGGRILDAFERQLRSDEEMALLVAKFNWNEFHKVGEAFLRDRAFMMRALELDGRVLQWIHTSLRRDFDMLVMATANYFNCLDHQAEGVTVTNGIDGHPGGDATIIPIIPDHNDRRLHPSQELPQFLYRSLNSTLANFGGAGLRDQIKASLDLHDTFVSDFLRGVAIPSRRGVVAANAIPSRALPVLPATTPSRKNDESESPPAARRSKLPKLDRDHDPSSSVNNDSYCSSSSSSSLGDVCTRKAAGSETTAIMTGISGRSANILKKNVNDEERDSGDKDQGLAMLNRGVETSEAFKRLIAEYLGVPTGARLTLLRRAHSNIQQAYSSSSKIQHSSFATLASSSILRPPGPDRRAEVPTPIDALVARRGGGGGGGADAAAAAAAANVPAANAAAANAATQRDRLAIRGMRVGRRRHALWRHGAGRDNDGANDGNLNDNNPPPPPAAGGGAGGVVAAETIPNHLGPLRGRIFPGGNMLGRAPLLNPPRPARQARLAHYRGRHDQLWNELAGLLPDGYYGDLARPADDDVDHPIRLEEARRTERMNRYDEQIRLLTQIRPPAPPQVVNSSRPRDNRDITAIPSTTDTSSNNIGIWASTMGQPVPSLERWPEPAAFAPRPAASNVGREDHQAQVDRVQDRMGFELGAGIDLDVDVDVPWPNEDATDALEFMIEDDMDAFDASQLDDMDLYG